MDYVLFDREHTTELLCSTPSCTLITEPRLKRLLAKKVHRNTRTLSSIAHIKMSELTGSIVVGDGDKKIVEQESSVVAETPTILKPGGAGALRKNTRLRFLDLKASHLIESDATSETYEGSKNPFSLVANACFSNRENQAHTLEVVAKVLEFDSRTVKNTTVRSGDADGADLSPAIVVASKVVYIPPTSTLTMNFNNNGMFLIV